MVENLNTPTGDYLSLEDDALIAQCEVDNYRARGPGGQKRNKTSSAVRLRHLATGLAVTAVEDRSQHVNKRRALRRLREAIALHVRGPVDLERYEPSQVVSACISADGRFRVGPRDHQRYAAIREVLDVLAACRMRVREAARHLDLTTAHLVKLIQQDPKLWERVNQMRAAAGVKPLR